MEIVQYKRLGVWNVPYLALCYLVQGAVIHNEKTRFSFNVRNYLNTSDLKFFK